jgi:hypothetical protein
MSTHRPPAAAFWRHSSVFHERTSHSDTRGQAKALFLKKKLSKRLSWTPCRWRKFLWFFLLYPVFGEGGRVSCPTAPYF